MNVQFTEGLPIQQAVAEINFLSAPQIIIWYIGCYGLRKAGVDFYKNFLITPVMENDSEATFWLVDLTAWNAFKNAQSSIKKSNSCCNAIEHFFDDYIRCIRSANIFKKMQEITDPDIINYFSLALQRTFISKASASCSNEGVFVKEIFSDNCLIMTDWYNHDVSKAYSAFQYLEGCLLVDEIFTQQIKLEQLNNLQIVFALPNDELKYYKDEAGSFQKDVEFLISKRCESANLENIKLEIHFISFNYGTELHHRPYNAPGKILKKNSLLYSDIAGVNKTIKN